MPAVAFSFGVGPLEMAATDPYTVGLVPVQTYARADAS
jgi:hypothetical protein